jgi:hypothetical protein
MSFIITLYTREGIVMASDSRLTLNVEQQTPNGQRVMIAAGMSDSNYKTFLAKEKIGISTFGQADINGNPISGFIQSFISQHNDAEISVSEFANELNEHFRTFSPVPDAGFHISGYEIEDEELKPKVYRVAPFHNQVNLVNPENEQGEQQGATWDGESDLLMRLIQPVFMRDEQGQFQALPQFPIPWQFFTIQDAIDFAVFAIQTTIDCVKFFPRAKTVGGPIDVLVINREKAFWVNRKELKINAR